MGSRASILTAAENNLFSVDFAGRESPKFPADAEPLMRQEFTSPRLLTTTRVMGPGANN
jgi:hypothetical protein